MFDKNKKPENKKEEKRDEVEANDKAKEEKKDPLKELQEEVEKYKALSEDWKNKYYMAFADTQNLRKSLEADHREALRFRAMGFVENLLPALDSFHLALSATPNSEEAKNYKQGFEFIYKQIMASLEEEGVSEIEPKIDENFDASYMHAIDLVPYIEGKEGKVAKVYSKCYKLHDRIVAPAKVAVYSKKQVEEKSQKEDASNNDNKEEADINKA